MSLGQYQQNELGSAYTSTLKILNNLALFYADHGRLTDAEGIYNRALTGKNKTLDV